jgi:hypothetical protein
VGDVSRVSQKRNGSVNVLLDQQLDRANGDWDYYDAEIRRVVNDYNMHLRNAPHFHLLDWRLVKAMM